MSSSTVENFELFECGAEPDSGAESVSLSTSTGLEQQRVRRFVPCAPATARSAALAAHAASPSASASSSSRRSSLDDANDLDGSCGDGRTAGSNEAPVCRPRLYLWLKQLRLHKYEQLFAELSFPEMLALTSEWLESREVTLGARRKMLLELQRLAARVDAVAHLHERLDAGRVRLADAIAELDSALSIPFSPLALQSRAGVAACAIDAPAFDVAARFLLVSSKIFKMLNCDECDTQLVVYMCSLLLRASLHEGFSPEQLATLGAWRHALDMRLPSELLLSRATGSRLVRRPLRDRRLCYSETHDRRPLLQAVSPTTLAPWMQAFDSRMLPSPANSPFGMCPPHVGMCIQQEPSPPLHFFPPDQSCVHQSAPLSAPIPVLISGDQRPNFSPTSLAVRFPPQYNPMPATLPLALSIGAFAATHNTCPTTTLPSAQASASLSQITAAAPFTTPQYVLTALQSEEASIMNQHQQQPQQTSGDNAAIVLCAPGSEWPAESAAQSPLFHVGSYLAYTQVAQQSDSPTSPSVLVPVVGPLFAWIDQTTTQAVTSPMPLATC